MNNRIAASVLTQHAPSRIGEQVHINHEGCPAGEDTKRRLYIKRTGYAIIAYCHHCNGHGLMRSTGTRQTLGWIKEQLVNKYNAPSNEEVLLPDDIQYFVGDWPNEALAYLGGYELTQVDVVKYNLCYSPSMNRLIFPYYDSDGKLVFWQGRDMSGKSDLKWLMAKSCNKPLGYFPSKAGDDIQYVIVEDPVSAIKIVKYSDAHALCLYGTQMSDEQLEWAIAQRDHTNWYVLLDQDDAGRDATPVIVNRLKLAAGSSSNKSIGGLRGGITPDFKSPKDISKEKLSSYW